MRKNIIKNKAVEFLLVFIYLFQYINFFLKEFTKIRKE